MMNEPMDLVKTVLNALPKDLAYLTLGLVLLVVARFFKDFMTPYKLSEQLTAKDNPAAGISMAGYYAAVLIICLGPLFTPPSSETVPFWQDLLITGGYGLLGVVLLNAARFILDKALLTQFSTVKEVIEDRNVGTGAVEMGAYVASGLIVAAALHGEGGGPHTTLAFFFLGQVALVIYGRIYSAACRYDVHKAIEEDNVAAGVALGLNLIAMGVVLAGAISGDFKAWDYNLVRFGLLFAIGTVVLLVLRLIVDFVLLPGVRIDKEIQEDKNLNAAWVEGAVLAGMAAIFVAIF